MILFKYFVLQMYLNTHSTFKMIDVYLNTKLFSYTTFKTLHLLHLTHGEKTFFFVYDILNQSKMYSLCIKIQEIKVQF